MQFEIQTDRDSIRVNINSQDGEAVVNEQKMLFEFTRQENGRYLLRIGTKLFVIDDVEMDGNDVSFMLNGRWHTTNVKNEQDLLLEKLGFESAITQSAGLLTAPMPGKILEIMVKEGDSVKQGQPVAILEAMKMENELKAPCSGKITTVHAGEGQNLEKTQPILDIEPIG